MAKDIWRRIHYDGAEEEALPSGDIMLHFVFKDKYGNTFKWGSPPWRDVEDVFVRSAQTESRNAPEGVWDEQLKGVLQKIPYRRHDVDIFKRWDAIMNEQDLTNFLYGLEAGHSFRDSQSSKLEKFLWFFSYQSNRYVSRKLYDLAERLCNALTELGEFLWDKVYDIPLPHDAGDTKMGLYPYFDIVVRNRQDAKKWREQYDRYVAELYKLVEAARQAYQDYRVHIRETLFQ